MEDNLLELLKSLKLHLYDCEFIDIRIEESQHTMIQFFQREFHSFTEEKKIGAFIRIFTKNRWYYTSTTEIDNLEVELQKLLESSNILLKREMNDIEYNENIINNLSDDYAYLIPKEEKINFLSKIRECFENDPLVANPFIAWKDEVLQKYYINNKGNANSYNKGFSGIILGYQLREESNIYDGNFIRTCRFFEEFDQLIEDFKKDFVEAKQFLKVPTIEPGKYITVLSPKATGIFAHESFGHKSEADFMIGDDSMLKEWEIGKKVASDIVTIIDSGLDESCTGYCPFDDEGIPASKTYLIKNGVLTSRLHDTETAKILNEDKTGNGRSINFEYEPIVRMTCTYVDKGDLTLEELIKPIEFGYFIKSVKHGSGMSTFTIAVDRAYKIEHGKITEPVKINIATGTVFQTMYDIDGISNEIKIDSMVFGGCGKMNQWPLMVAFGGPYIRVKSLNLS